MEKVNFQQGYDLGFDRGFQKGFDAAKASPEVSTLPTRETVSERIERAADAILERGEKLTNTTLFNEVGLKQWRTFKRMMIDQNTNITIIRRQAERRRNA